MICPKCKIKYRKGYTVCIDCEVDLVETFHESANLFEEKHNGSLSFVPVLSTFNKNDISLIKDILNESWIEYYFEDEDRFEIGGKNNSLILMVREDQVPTVLLLLKDFEVHYLMHSDE